VRRRSRTSSGLCWEDNFSIDAIAAVSSRRPSTKRAGAVADEILAVEDRALQSLARTAYAFDASRIDVDEHGVKEIWPEPLTPQFGRTRSSTARNLVRNRSPARGRRPPSTTTAAMASMLKYLPNKGLMMCATADAQISRKPQCRVYNDWAWEMFGPHNDRCRRWLPSPLPTIEGSSLKSSASPNSGSAASRCLRKPVFNSQDARDPTTT